MKIAFEIAERDTWQGGISNLSFLFHALKQAYGDHVSFCLLQRYSDYNIPVDLIECGVQALKIPASRRWSARWMSRLNMRRSEIDVLFGLLLRHEYGKIPTLSWIPDFQHIHLPDMFNASEREKRDRLFLRSAKLASRIILMSDAVRKDFESFASQYAHKARVVRPVNDVPDSIYGANPKFMLELYDLPEKFLYLPNQFWKHKNHEAVFRAVKILKDRGMRPFVVCSGYPGDFRYPTYFADLCQTMSRLGIRNHIAFLGLIPREHVLLLMRQAIGVLNPSLFEGFGLTVEEARSVGKRVVLSDIPAHREQDPPGAAYFNPYDCEDLAEKLGAIWRESVPGPDFELEIEARRVVRSRLRASGESFMSVLHEVTPHRGDR